MAIIWDRPHLFAVAIEHTAGTSIHVTSTLAIDVDEGQSDAESLSDVTEQLRANFESIDTLSVILPRDRATWRDFSVPNVPDAELPAIVQFQFATQVAGSSDKSVIDFLAPTQRTVGEPIQVQAVAVPERTVMMARQLATSLGAELAGVGLSSLYVLELAASIQPSWLTSPHLAVVSAADRYSEVTETVNGDITRCNARRTEAGQHGRHKALSAARQRLELSFEDDAGATIVVFQDDSESDSAEHSDSIHRNAIALDDLPFASDADVEKDNALVLAAVGSVLVSHASSASKARQVDFAKPREPVPPRDRTKDYLKLAAAAVVLLVVGIGWKTWSDAADLDDRVEAARTKLKGINEFLDRKGELRETRATLETFLGSQMPLNDIVDNILASMPPRDRLIIASLEPGQTTGDNVARVKGKAFAATRADAERFEAELDRYYLVKPQAKTPSDERPGYAFQLNFEFDVPRKPKKSAASDTTSSPTASRTRNTKSEVTDGDA